MQLKDAFAIAADLLDPPDDHWKPLPHQIPPAGKWFAWLLLGGRGMGKTAMGARHLHEHVHGPPCLPDVPGGHWPGIIGPTLGDAVTSCVLGPSGLRAHDSGIKVRQTAGGTTVRWSNGVEGKLFGAHTPEDVERLRSGGNRCIMWAEELAAWRYMQDSWQHMRYGLRVGPWPHVIVSTTPKNRMLIKELSKKAMSGDVDEITGELEVVMTTGTTADNPHLDQRVKRMLYEDYSGTRIGRQELFGEILEDIESALWNHSIIDKTRLMINEQPDSYDMKVVGVDPAVGGANDHGIIVCGKVNKYRTHEDNPFSNLPHGFILDDQTCSGSPNTWAKRAIAAYYDHEANYIVAERNNGGDMVANTIRGIDSTVPIKTVWATRGKARRAEPISMMYEQNRIHHIGELPSLEDQMCEFDPDDPDNSWSPDRMDAMVWAMTELLIGNRQLGTSKMLDTRLRRRR